MLNQNKEVLFNEFLHEYTISGQPLIGVTTLLHKHGLAPDYGAVPAEQLKAAADRGTAIHQLLEDYDNGEAVFEDENLRAYKSLGLRVMASEYLVSDNEVVASFVDKVLEDYSIADVKTSYSLNRSYVSWQTSIYAYLLERQNPGVKVPHLYCIHIRDGKAKLIELERVPDAMVEALLKAEAEGRIWSPDAQLPDTIGDGELSVLVDALGRIAEYKMALKAEETRAKEIQDRLYQYMTEKGVSSLPCAYGVFSRKAESERSSIDSERLKKEMPDVYAKYVRTTRVKGSISFKPTTK